MARLDMLSDAASRLLDEQDPDSEILPALFRSMGAELSADATFGYLLADVDAGLKPRFVGGLDPDQVGQCLRSDSGQGICGTVTATAKPLHVGDIQNCADPRAELVRALGVTTFACEPLVARGRVIGILCFASRTRRSFDEEDLAFFRLIARHVAVARDRALQERPAGEASQLRHRLRNLLSNVQAVAAISARSAQGMDRFIRCLSDRIAALGSVQELLGSDSAELAELLRSQLRDISREGAVRLHGPCVAIPAALAVPLGMAVHELKDNALAFGSLSSPGGVLAVRWRVERDGSAERLIIDWRERGGPPAAEPQRTGFGTELLEGLIGNRIRVRRSFAARGMTAVIEVTLSER